MKQRQTMFIAFARNEIRFHSGDKVFLVIGTIAVAPAVVKSIEAVFDMQRQFATEVTRRYHVIEDGTFRYTEASEADLFATREAADAELRKRLAADKRREADLLRGWTVCR